VDLMWRVVALTVATFTVLLAVRRVVMVVSGLVFARYVAVGGLAAFSVNRDAADGYAVRFEAGGPAVFHNVAVTLCGVQGTVPAPPLRHTMIAGDGPLEWTFRLSEQVAQQAWVTVTWVRPYLQGVESESLAHWLQGDQLYEWRWYSDTYRHVRTVVRFAARRWSVGGETLRELPLQGRWRRTSSNGTADLLGPTATPPPRT
jgi:hypothetical protein